MSDGGGCEGVLRAEKGCGGGVDGRMIPRKCV